MGEGEPETVEASKKGRHRKKQLYTSIAQQMEFYFSDSNLSKDRFLSKLISDNPYVDIKVFLSFNKIRKLNCTVEDICKAISKSELIEVSEDKEKICRKTPVKVKENIDECTIYVENIKADANHEWLKQVFSDFGKVVYVSIPKYKQNKGNKGFAFIEFETENEAQNALDYFENIGCKMPSNTNPEYLRSIITFEDDGSKSHMDINNKNSDKVEVTNTESSKKRKLSVDDVKQEKKIKIEVDINTDLKRNMKKEKSDSTEDSTETKEKNNRHEEKTKTDIDLDTEAKSETKTENFASDNMENKKKKKYKKDKKKNFIKELGLQILSKKEWKKMRNRYLDLQKKKMKEFKQYLHKHNQKCKKSKKNKDDIALPTEEHSVSEEVPVKLEYIPGVIVKLKLLEPCMDVKKLKNDIRAITPDVKYIDIPLSAGGEEVYVRFSSSDIAKEFCRQEFNGERTILENEEEKSYWDKIQNDRALKFTKSIKKQRGRDKLLKKAERERARHIRFDEGE